MTAQSGSISWCTAGEMNELQVFEIEPLLQDRKLQMARVTLAEGPDGDATALHGADEILPGLNRRRLRREDVEGVEVPAVDRLKLGDLVLPVVDELAENLVGARKIGRASCRDRLCQYV